MSGLNLTPNPLVLATQAGIFLTSLYTIKTLMITPYLKVRGKRQELTVGSQSEAGSILSKNAETMTMVESKIAQAVTEARQIGDKLRAAAQEERKTILAQAHSEAQRVMSAMEENIKSTLVQERQKIPNIVEQISQICFEQTVH